MLYYYDIYSKGESVTLKGHTGGVRSVNFSTDANHLVTASDDKTAKVSFYFILYHIQSNYQLIYIYDKMFLF